MKKIFLVLSLICISLATYADELYFIDCAPVNISKGVNAKDGVDVTFNLHVPSTSEVVGLDFDLYLPNVVLTSYYDEDEEEYVSTFKGGTLLKSTFTFSCVKYSDSNQDIAGYTRYAVTIFEMSKKSLKSSGTLAVLKAGSIGDGEAGVYPIYIKNQKVCRSDNSVIYAGDDANASSYIVYGDVSSITFDAYGKIGSAVISNLPKNATVDFSKATAVYGSGSNNVTAKYSRSVSNAWNTICLPFAAKSNANVQYYTINSIGEEALEVAAVSELAAGTPALVKVTGTAIDVTEANVPLSAALNNGGNMVGTFEKINVTDASAYYIKNNEFHQCTDNFNVAAFKAYIKASGSAKEVLGITESDETAIKALCGEGEVSVDAIYGVNGARQNGLKKGINIVTLSNGATKKIIVK